MEKRKQRKFNSMSIVIIDRRSPENVKRREETIKNESPNNVDTSRETQQQGCWLHSSRWGRLAAVHLGGALPKSIVGESLSMAHRPKVSRGRKKQKSAIGDCTTAPPARQRLPSRLSESPAYQLSGDSDPSIPLPLLFHLGSCHSQKHLHHQQPSFLCHRSCLYTGIVIVRFISCNLYIP